MNWKASLDRYLTTEPPDDFTPFVEKVYEYLPDNVWEEMERTKFIDSELESSFLWHCMDCNPEMTALNLITLFYKVESKYHNSKHLGKFYANNLYLL